MNALKRINDDDDDGDDDDVVGGVHLVKSYISSWVVVMVAKCGVGEWVGEIIRLKIFFF